MISASSDEDQTILNDSFRDIWIVNDSGKLLFQHAIDVQINDQVFGGFIHALDSMLSTFEKHDSSILELSS